MTGSEENKKWKISDIGGLFKNSLIAVLKGEFLLRLNAGKYFVHILYTFFLFGVIIWISLMIETTMARVETNKKEIKELEIVHAQRVFDVVNISRRSQVQERLREMGSDVHEAEKPATILIR